MSSLQSIYENLVGADQKLAEKIASAEAPSREVAAETAKLASDYDEAGRRLARVHWANFVAHEKTAEGAAPFMGKETPEEEAAEQRELERKKKGKEAKGEGEEKKEEKSDEERVEEKKASIAQRMLEDPAYRSAVIAKYHQE